MSAADQSAAEIVRSALVWDDHSGFMPDPSADLENLSLWRDAGVDYLSINVGFDLMSPAQTMATLEAFRGWLLSRPEHFVLARTGADVRRAKSAGKLAVTFDLEGMNALDGRVEMVEAFHRLGVRQMLFAYNRNNLAGGGCHDEDHGLTAFGREVVDEMKRLGMFIDVSHAGIRTSLEVMEYADAPVIFSHSNARARHPHGRNITDEQIRACAQSGGVIAANGVGLFLGAPSAERLADHLDHLIETAGPQHVGLGLDYGFPVEVAGLEQILEDHPEFWPSREGYLDGPVEFLAPDQIAEVAAIMLRRGHADSVIRGVLGENFARLADTVWR